MGTMASTAGGTVLGRERPPRHRLETETESESGTCSCRSVVCTIDDCKDSFVLAWYEGDDNPSIISPTREGRVVIHPLESNTDLCPKTSDWSRRSVESIQMCFWRDSIDRYF